MSAFMQDKAHFSAIIRTALQGPSDPRAISPDSVWHGPRWSALPADALAELDWQQQGQAFRRLEHNTAKDVATMLYDENVASIRHRYADADESSMVVDEPPFTIAEIMRGRRLMAVQALQAISGLEYQSCEHPEWNTSEALRFLESFRLALCSFLTRDVEGCWSIHDTADHA